MKKFLTVIFLFCLFSISVQADTGPIAPTQDMIPKTKEETIKDLDLPYKPIDIEGDEGDTGEESGEQTGETTEDGSTNDKDTEQSKIDWDNIPFIPSKSPDLKPAPDPKI